MTGPPISRTILAGFATGLALGVIARVWMRLITSDPEFSWAGTLFIVGAFGLFGLFQAVVWAARRSGWRRRGVTVVRIVAVVFTLPLFTGAGSIMMPTVAAASLALWRDDWPRVLRAAVGVLAAPAAVFVVSEIGAEFGWGPSTWGRILLFVAIYAVVTAALRAAVSPLRDGWRVPRWIRFAAVLLVAAVAVPLIAAALL